MNVKTKKFLKIFGIVVGCLVLLLVILRITGLNPHERIPGLWLTGQIVTTPVSDWSFVEKYPTDDIQTQSWYGLPHSVTTGFIVYNGQLYITSFFDKGMTYPTSKAWDTNAIRDPHVRLKFGDQLYDRTILPVDDPVEREAVLNYQAEQHHQAPSDNVGMHLFRVLAG